MAIKKFQKYADYKNSDFWHENNQNKLGTVKYSTTKTTYMIRYSPTCTKQHANSDGSSGVIRVRNVAEPGINGMSET